MEADRQEQHERQHQAPGGGQSRPEPEQCRHANGNLAERDQYAEEDRDMGQGRDQRMDWASQGSAPELGLDRGRISGVEEPGIGELLQAGEAEREPEEGPQREQDATQ